MLELTVRTTTRVPVEAEVITPDRLAGLSADEVARQTVFHGNRKECLGEFFAVHGTCDDGRIVIRGDASRIKWIGAGMSRGQILIEGDAGMHLGAEMRGGMIEVRGSVGDWCGAEMRGGLIRVHGNAGHLLGAAYRGSPRGMRGGVILVMGQAGNEVASTMRRGLIFVAGSTGDFCGVSMIAGTVVLGAVPGARSGAGMKRGTILVIPPEPIEENLALLPTFRLACRYRPVFVRLLVRYLEDLGVRLPPEAGEGEYLRYSGDLVERGLGEILVWSRR